MANKTNRLLEAAMLVNRKAIKQYKAQIVTTAVNTAKVIIKGALKGFL